MDKNNVHVLGHTLGITEDLQSNFSLVFIKCMNEELCTVLLTLQFAIKVSLDSWVLAHGPVSKQR